MIGARDNGGNCGIRNAGEEREAIRTLPNFDAKIFEQCTGIDA